MVSRDTSPLDLDALESRIHALPPCELAGIALSLVTEVRRLRARIEADDGAPFEPVDIGEPGPRDLPVLGKAD